MDDAGKLACHNFYSPFGLGDKVRIDQDLIGHVASVCWAANGSFSVEVAWLHNGQSLSGWFAATRLSSA